LVAWLIGWLVIYVVSYTNYRGLLHNTSLFDVTFSSLVRRYWCFERISDLCFQGRM